MTKKKWTLAGVLGALVSLTGLWSFAQSDLVPATKGQLADAKMEFNSSVDEFRREYRCDRWGDRLRELLRLQREGDTSQALQSDIDDVRTKMRNNRCEDFE